MNPPPPTVTRQRTCVAEEGAFCRNGQAARMSRRKTGGSPGRKPGHTGVSHHRRSRETIHHRQDRCGRCRSTGISDVRTAFKQMIDIELMPKAVTVTHLCCKCVCSDCDAVTAPKPPGIKGTPLGPNLLVFLTSVWGKAVSAGNAITPPQRHVRYRHVQDCRKARAGSSIMQAAAHGRRNARIPFKITAHQDRRDPDQNRRSEAVRVGVHRGCGCGHTGGHPRSSGDRLPLSMMVCYMTPIIRPSLSVFGWRCL